MLEMFVSPVLVGRAREMELLDQALRAAQNGAGRCVLLAGEAGIGKSRLAAEIRARAADDGWLILQGHCAEQDASFPYGPWIDTLRAFLAGKSRAETAELLGSLSAELVKLLPELSLLIPSIRPTPPLEPAAEKHRLFESLARLCLSLCAARPLLVILEDLHWSDEPSLDLLQYLMRRIAAHPILVVGTLRTEDLSSGLAHRITVLSRDPGVKEIQLAPLARPEVEQMARAVFHPNRDIGSDWFETLLRLTEGNPFFVEEILKSLADASGPDKLKIPRSIQDLVQRRVERLSERTR